MYLVPFHYSPFSVLVGGLWEVKEISDGWMKKGISKTEEAKILGKQEESEER